MQGNLTVIQHYEPFVSSFVLSRELETEHRRIRELARKYKSEFLEFGSFMENETEILEESELDSLLHVTMNNSKKETDSRRSDGNESPLKKQRGGQKKEIFFNEGQAIYLLVLLGNTDRVRHLKKKLAKDFIKQRKLIAHLLAQKQNQDWIETRKAGKIERKKETDTIKKFVEYATLQGSKSAHMYYTNITKMQNRALFAVDFLNQKFDNIREVVSTFSLSALKVCDHIISKVLEEEMAKGTHYKDIYKIAKEKVEIFANTIGVLEVCQAIPCIDIQLEFSKAV